ncbi:MAG: hypothetical protein U0795_23980 [Pirellulales bacterium]
MQESIEPYQQQALVVPAMEPLISIQLHGKSPYYRPGDILECDYQIDAVSRDALQAVEASVLWYTEGKGDEDMGVHYFERRVPADVDDGDLRQWRRFRIPLPNSPLSYQGEIFSILWCVRVRAFLKRGKQSFYELPFRLGAIDTPRRRLQAE